MRALDYLADNLDGGWAGAWAQLGPGDTVGGGRGGHPLSPLSLLSLPSPTSGAPGPQMVCLWPSTEGGHLACCRATPYFIGLNTASPGPFFLSLVPALPRGCWLLLGSSTGSPPWAARRQRVPHRAPGKCRHSLWPHHAHAWPASDFFNPPTVLSPPVRTRIPSPRKFFRTHPTPNPP